MSRTITPTLRDIAQRCGVTAATVSRVLNANYSNNFSVSKEMRKNIFRTAAELGYRPNFVAKNLARRQTRVIGIIGKNTISGWPGDIYQQTLEAAIRFLQINGFNVCRMAPSIEYNASELPPWQVDGILVIQECSEDTIEEMERRQLPYVVINGPSGPSGSLVIPDDYEAVGVAVRHLAALGHRRIAYAGPTPIHRPHSSIQERHQAYLAELNKYNLSPVIGHDEPFISADEYLALAVMEEKATAVLAYDHIVALQLLHGASSLQIRIPRDISLMCFNDEYYCSLVRPSLTTLAIPSWQMGRLAAQVLLKNIQLSPSQRITECIKRPFKLTVRSSTGASLSDPDGCPAGAAWGSLRRSVDFSSS